MGNIKFRSKIVQANVKHIYSPADIWNKYPIPLKHLGTKQDTQKCISGVNYLTICFTRISTKILLRKVRQNIIWYPPKQISS